MPFSIIFLGNLKSCLISLMVLENHGTYGILSLFSLFHGDISVIYPHLLDKSIYVKRKLQGCNNCNTDQKLPKLPCSFPGFSSFLSNFHRCSPWIFCSVTCLSLVPSTVAVLPQSLKRQAHGKVSKATNPKVSAFSPMTC